MASRPDLQAALEELMGSQNVYFDPKTNIRMQYPCIVYSRYNIENDHANNKVYIQHTAYQVTVVDRNPDSEYVKKVSMLPFCSFDRNYVADNLHHDTFTLYY